MLDENGIEVAIESVPNPENRSCVVISRETERFLNEIHIHKTDARSSKELLDNHPESEEMVSTRFKETWADPCTKETRADSILFTRIKASFYTEEPFQSMRKSGSLFMLILNVEQLWQCQSPRRLRKYVATLTKKNENLVGSRHLDSNSSLESICTWKSARFRWRRVVTHDFWSQYREKNRMLHKQKMDSHDLYEVFNDTLVVFQTSQNWDWFGEERKKDKHRETVFPTPTNLVENDLEEEIALNDLTVPQRAPYIIRWKNEQNAVLSGTITTNEDTDVSTFWKQWTIREHQAGAKDVTDQPLHRSGSGPQETWADLFKHGFGRWSQHAGTLERRNSQKNN